MKETVSRRKVSDDASVESLTGKPKNKTKGWDSNPKKLLTNPLKMAEPVHRKPPLGATAGQSIRKFPRSSIQQIRDICLFYVRKCSGKYADNKTAARYVHQLAEEVMSQLAGVAGEIKRNRGEPELFQALLDEWNTHFPSSLGKVGSPKAVALLLQSQEAEIHQLKEDLMIERDKRNREFSDTLIAMDAQLQAYRNNVIGERKHRDQVSKKQQEDFNAKFEALEEKHAREIGQLQDERATLRQEIRKDFRNSITSLEQQVRQLQDQLEETEEDYKGRLERMKLKKDKKIKRLISKLRTAQEKYYALAADVQDDFTVMTSASAEEGSVISGAVKENNTLNKLAQKEKKRDQLLQRYAGNSNNLEVEPVDGEEVEGTIADSGTGESTKIASAAELKMLHRSVQSLQFLNKKHETTISELQSQINGLKGKISAELMRLQDLEQINSSLRRALGLKLKDQGSIDNVHRTNSSSKTIKNSPEILCHTPHFLDKADYKAPEYDKKDISGYNTAGHF